MNILETYNNEILKLCFAHRVKSLYVFGSAISNKFNNKSDVDLVVDFLPIDVIEYADNYYDLKFSLEETLKRKVDLLEERAIKNPYLKNAVNQEKQLVYEC